MVRINNISAYSDIDRKYLRSLAQRVWDSFHTQRCDATISIVPVEKIIELNTRYFEKNEPTDVISFNLGAGPKGHILADIYICPEVAEENALRFRCGFHEEIARLVIHGMLHCAGFDDLTAEQKQAMRTMEDNFLEKYPA